jgi:c-di-GMP-binding flagellar brake protein YcgR
MTLRAITLSVEEANRCGSQENGTPAGLGNRGQEEQRENSPMVVDISAGGIRFASNIEYEIDEDVICHLELPGSLCFVLPAQVVRSTDSSPLENDRTNVGVEFSGLDETNPSQLLRWVYREQAQRHREEPKD